MDAVIATRNDVKETKLYKDVRCDGCGRRFLHGCPKPDEHPLAPWENLQPNRGLEVDLSGGYGMLIDPMDTPADDLKLLFCEHCSRELANHFPAFERAYARAGTDATTAHACALEGGRLVWSSYHLCDCGLEEQRASRAKHARWQAEAVEKYGRHPYEAQWRGNCRVCNGMPNQRNHDEDGVTYAVTAQRVGDAEEDPLLFDWRDVASFLLAWDESLPPLPGDARDRAVWAAQEIEAGRGYEIEARSRAARDWFARYFRGRGIVTHVEYGDDEMDIEIDAAWVAEELREDAERDRKLRERP